MKLGTISFSILVLANVACTAQNNEQTEVYTLYRDSPYLESKEGAKLDPKWNRVHIATFDAVHMDDDYNRSHCDRVKKFYNNEWQSFFDEKPEHYSKFWCEIGRFKE